MRSLAASPAWAAEATGAEEPAASATSAASAGDSPLIRRGCISVHLICNQMREGMLAVVCTRGCLSSGGVHEHWLRGKLWWW